VDRAHLRKMHCVERIAWLFVFNNGQRKEKCIVFIFVIASRAGTKKLPYKSTNKIAIFYFRFIKWSETLILARGVELVCQICIVLTGCPPSGLGHTGWI